MSENSSKENRCFILNFIKKRKEHKTYRRNGKNNSRDLRSVSPLCDKRQNKSFQKNWVDKNRQKFLDFFQAAQTSFIFLNHWQVIILRSSTSCGVNFTHMRHGLTLARRIRVSDDFNDHLRIVNIFQICRRVFSETNAQFFVIFSKSSLMIHLSPPDRVKSVLQGILQIILYLFDSNATTNSFFI